ncbi:MAG: citrate synthase family protein [Chloroflexota bacterium]
MNNQHLSAKEAADMLNISLPTLYSYVSRKMIRSVEADSKRRTKRYLRADVERLLNRKLFRENPELAAETALDWGDPILESAITKIENGRFYYRGRDACELALSASFESVCHLLWNGDLVEKATPIQVQTLPEAWLTVLVKQPNLRLIDQFQAILPLSGAGDVAGYDLSKTAVSQTGRCILGTYLALLGRNQPKADRLTTAQFLAQIWSPNWPHVDRLINMALVLCADHELNVSAFTARTVASARSTPYTAVNAGLSALTGSLHGGHTERVEALIREAQYSHSPQRAVADRLRRGDDLPGFFHKLYPDGDPRATLFMTEIKKQFPDSEIVQLIDGVITAVYQAIGQHPTIDFGLVALALAADFPKGAPLALFAISRTAGWIGHIIEQYEQKQLIRPRARYIGR